MTIQRRAAYATIRRTSSLWILFFGGLALLALTSPALAHRSPTANATPDGAIVIPNLSHGQMIVIAENSGAIMDLAAAQFPTDPIMRRLEAFIILQRFTCMWGIIPGSLSDEASSFNDCGHSYLAATRALLIHLQGMPGDRSAVQALVQKIELEMLANQASLNLCRYSDEAFNTREYIVPHAGPIPLDPVDLLKMAIGLMAFGWQVACLYSLRIIRNTGQAKSA